MRAITGHSATGSSFATPRRRPRSSGNSGDRPDLVYASAIFEKSRPVCERVLEVYPEAIVGGTGWSESTTLESIGVHTKAQDYSDYPKWRQSIGFTQRGCRYACGFCKVPRIEGKVWEENTIADLWRGEDHPRELILLDNDFFGQEHWTDRIAEIREGRFKVCFCQGINARALTEKGAQAIASVDYRDDSMKHKRIYTAWDNRSDEDKLFRGLNLLTGFGVKPDQIMVYVLVGYDHATRGPLQGLTADDFHRMERLREFGARPYPMPFHRSRELVCFQWWAQGGRHKKIKWKTWSRPNTVLNDSVTSMTVKSWTRISSGSYSSSGIAASRS